MKSAAILIVVLVAAQSPAAAQTRARQAPSAPKPPSTSKPSVAPQPSSARDLAEGWSALAGGRTTEAEAAAEKLLRAGSRRHDAVSLTIAARVQGGRVDRALDRYEEWIKTAPHEDVFLLQPIAGGTLEALATASDAGIRVDALRELAEAGDKSAGERLAAMAAAGGMRGMADEALARGGDAQAIARLTRLVGTKGGRDDVSGAIEALAAARPAEAVTTIAAALDPARAMPTKMAAARALGELGSADGVPALRQALKDPEPSVRMMAAAALARLGDQGGADVIREMENSPVTDIRLMAAEASAAASPTGGWVATATTALQDPDPLVRLTAARMLIAHGADPAAARATLDRALNDPNPALRLVAVGTLEQIPAPRLGDDIPTLRRLLRDADARVRMGAASALLMLAGGIG